MINSSLNILNTISYNKNPEIYHYNATTHPGIQWYIKTICPSANLLTEQTRPIHKFWYNLQNIHPNLVKITDIAFLWDGSVFPNWNTIWLHEKIDIEWSITSNKEIDYKLIEFDIGLKLSAEKIEKLINEIITSDRLSNDSMLEYNSLLNITNFLKTHTSERRSKEKRNHIRVL